MNNPELRPTIYLGNNRAITKTIYGHKIIVNTRDISIAPHILIDGYWEKWITDVFLSLIKPGMNVLDIGANVGFYSLLAAEKIGSQGSLICFEANPEMSDIVFQNLQINGFGSRSKVVDKAVYSENSSLTFNIFEKFLSSSSLWTDLGDIDSRRDSIKELTVEGVTLDHFFSAGTRIDFIKIDAEGAEPFILKGAKRVLEDNPNVIILMEFAPLFITKAYGSVEILYGELKSMGFRIFRIEHDSTLFEMSLTDAISTHHCDVVMQRNPG